MIATREQPSLLDQWRQRLGGRRHRRARPRPLAAMGYLANGPVIDGLIEIEKLCIYFFQNVIAQTWVIVMVNRPSRTLHVPLPSRTRPPPSRILTLSGLSSA